MFVSFYARSNVAYHAILNNSILRNFIVPTALYLADGTTDGKSIDGIKFLR